MNQGQNEDSTLQDLADDLAQKLGNAIWAFTKIEWISYDYLKKLNGENFLRIVGDQSFQTRMTFLSNLVNESPANEALKPRVRRAIKKATELAKIRNTIVHNPWQIIANFEIRQLDSEIHKYDNNKYTYTVQDVEKLSTNSEELAQELTAALTELTIGHRTQRGDPFSHMI